MTLNNNKLVLEQGDRLIVTTTSGHEDDWHGGYHEKDTGLEFVIQSDNVDKHFDMVEGRYEGEDFIVRDNITIEMTETSDKKVIRDNGLGDCDCISIGKLDGLTVYRILDLERTN